jgi:hypothetical protein
MSNGFARCARNSVCIFPLTSLADKLAQLQSRRMVAVIIILMRALRLLAFFALGTIAFIMWYPQRYPFGIDLGNQVLQTCAFAVCAFLWILVRGSRLGSDPYFEYRSNFLPIDAAMIRRNVSQIAIELFLLAAVLELGQWALPNRVSNFGDFLVNALAVVAISVPCYIVLALALRTPLGRRLARYFVTID